MATKVHLRQKAITKGRKSLYLDFYPPTEHPQTGIKTRREFLNLYVFDKPKSVFDKTHNAETLQLAQSIRQQRENQINKPEIYNGYEKEQLRIKELGAVNFIIYFKKLTDKRDGSNVGNWNAAFKYLVAFTGDMLKISDLNLKLCNEFKEYLLNTKLTNNSAQSYFNKFKAALKQAYKDGYLQTDLNAKVQQIKAAETQRNFLTLDELNRLVKTDCQSQILKQAALFSALTGLRFSDIEKLTWNEVEFIEGNGYFIKFTQQKTQGVEMLPISNQAFSLLGSRNKHNTKVFEGLIYSDTLNNMLNVWVKNSEITKKITFHCFRHTFATLQLTNGTDIYTVSKMLGHRELKTTQVYAKIIDSTKRKAANNIKIEL